MDAGRRLVRRAAGGALAALTLAAGTLAVDSTAEAGMRQNAALPYGPYTCKQSLVWREATTPDDKVCVTPNERDEAKRQNAAGPSRVQPGGGAYGPDTCKQGFVWRETRPSDHVCVTPRERTWERTDNQRAVYGYEDPTQIPQNGVHAAWENTHLSVSGSGFTPNAGVYVYGYRDRAWVRGEHMAVFRADGNGQLSGRLAQGCNVARDRTMHVLLVDDRTGLVRNAGQEPIPCGWA